MTKQQIIQTLLNTDAYKLSHRTLYPKNTTTVFSNFTPRSGNQAKPNLGFVIADGMRFVIHKVSSELITALKGLTPEIAEEIITIEARVGSTGIINSLLELKTYVETHGELPLAFRAVKEGSFHNYKIPVLTINNTDPKFAWLVNYLETWITSLLWPIITASTTAYVVKQSLTKYATLSGVDTNLVDYQAHDFSFRSMMGPEAAMLVGLGHLQHFNGSDNMPSIVAAGKGSSVVATEHSVMSSGTKDGESDTYKRLLTENPTGLLSIVSDTWNIFNVCDVILPNLKKEIEARDGQLVIRPDSGEAVEQLLGHDRQELGVQELKASTLRHQRQLGLFKLIEKHFGYTLNDKGFKVLPITFLWGEGMTIDKIEKLFTAVTEAGYASSNVFIGLGSRAYQYKTRDAHGFAMKATYMEINGKSVNITKNPVTDNGVKKSAKGLLAVIDGELVQETTWEIVNSDANQLLLVSAS